MATFDVKFESNKLDCSVSFGVIHRVTDGGFESGYAAGHEEGYAEGKSDGDAQGYERGYAEGHEVGNAEGYTKGHTEGVEQGYADGIQFAQDEINSLVAKTIVQYRNDSVTSIGNYVFAEIGSLEEVDLPMVKTVGQYAFQSSTKLHTVKLPRAETIGNRAFVNAFALSYLDLPVCTSIGTACFHGARIKTLILRSETVCTIPSGVFQTVPIVYVPDNLVEQYKTATNWSDYADKIKPISELEE